MGWKVDRRVMASGLMIVSLLASFLLGTINTRQQTSLALSSREMNTYEQFVQNTARRHKAPFLKSARLLQVPTSSKPQSQPLPTATLAQPITHKAYLQAAPDIDLAIDTRYGYNYALVSHGSPSMSDQQYSMTQNGKDWMTDVLQGSINPITHAPYNYYSTPKVVFDRDGNTFITRLAENGINDSNTGYVNFDSEISVWQTHHADDANGQQVQVAYAPCNGNVTHLEEFNCPAQLLNPAMTMDVKSGRMYVYYTYFCGQYEPSQAQGSQQTCKIGEQSIAANSSAIFESHRDSIDKPFTAPALVSGTLKQSQFATMVVDEQGTPHVFFTDFSESPTISLYQATRTENGWNVYAEAITTFRYTPPQNPNWSFSGIESVAPSCAIQQGTAYCAFAATSLGTTAVKGTPDIYMARIDVQRQRPGTTYIVNEDWQQHNYHLFPQTMVSTRGEMYIGWLDSSHDPTQKSLQYSVGISKDAGQSFRTEQPLSTQIIEPCQITPDCSGIGIYARLGLTGDGRWYILWVDPRDKRGVPAYVPYSS